MAVQVTGGKLLDEPHDNSSHHRAEYGIQSSQNNHGKNDDSEGPQGIEIQPRYVSDNAAGCGGTSGLVR